MGRIDSISKALETEYGFDLSNGKVVKTYDHNMAEPDPLLPADIVVESETITEVVTVEEVDNSQEKTAEHLEDEITVKRNMRELISKGMDLADDMFEFVRISESPKAFEPAAAYLKTLVELNEKLLDVHDRGSKNKKKDEKPIAQVNTQNNTVIYRDPASALKALKNKGQ